MNEKIEKLALGILVLLILLINSLSIEASEKKKTGTPSVGKKQRITVTAIYSEEFNFCGNRMGGFAAKYQGKTVRIIFEFGQIAAYIDGNPKDLNNLLCAEKLSFLNKSIDAIGSWAGKDMDVDNFLAKKIFIPGKRDYKPTVL
jgi:hypothetical protein